MEKLNLGCGKDYRKDFINIDKGDFHKDYNVDIEKGLPFGNNIFGYVYASHILEHIHPDKLDWVIGEICRVCKNGAIVEVYVPHFSCGKTYQEYKHLTFFSYFTFRFEDLKLLKRRFNFMRIGCSYTERPYLNVVAKIINPVFSFLPNLFPFVYERFFCWIYPMEELYFKFEVSKEEG